MIKFFRRIRYNLMEIGKTSPNDSGGRAGKYFKYAISEIILVVIGILIALQINNWNEDRKSALLLENYENSIIDELKTDLTTLDSITISNNQGRKLIMDYVNYYNSDSLNLTLLNSKYTTANKSLIKAFHTSTFTIQDLISTGNLKLFTSQKRNALLSLKNIQDNFMYYEKEVLDQVISTTSEFEKNADMLFENGVVNKENSTMENWRFDVNSKQMRLRNNIMFKKIRLYDFQEIIYDDIRLAIKEILALFEK